MSEIKQIMNDPKRRSMFVATFAVCFLMLIVGVFFVMKNRNANKPDVTTVSLAGNPNIQTTPGNNPSPQYNQAVKESNAQRSQEAVAQGKSTELTITKASDSSTSPIDDINKQAEQLRAKREQEEKDRRGREEADRLAALERERLEKERLIPPPVIVTPVVQPTPVVTPVPVQAKTSNYSTDQHNLLLALSQSYKYRGTAIETDFTGNKGGNNSNSANNTNNTNNANNATSNQLPTNNNSDVVILKAGDMLNAVLETAINSDEPSPVLVRVVTGPFKGAKGVCNMQRNGEKTLVQCTRLSIPSMSKSIQVNLVAVDPTTTRTGLATSVDNHYFERYVIGLGAAFLKGYADAITRQNTLTSVTPSGAIVVSQGQLSSADILKSGIGEVGKNVAEETKQNSANLKPTVYVSAGTAIGLLATEDVLIR